jgi:GxxExxY protein
MNREEINDLTNRIIGCAMEVHKELGPGLLESIYQRCLSIALSEKGLSHQCEVSVPIWFHGQKVSDDGYRIDILVEDMIVIELKSVSSISVLNCKQLNTYLRMTGKPCGLLINFNVELLKDGIKRVVNGFF